MTSPSDSKEYQLPWLVHDVLYHIFSYLDGADLLRASQVCKVWHEVAMKPRFWRSVRLKNCNVYYLKMFEFLDKQGTESLTFVDCAHFQIPENMKKVKKLKEVEYSEFNSFMHWSSESWVPFKSSKLEFVDKCDRIDLNYLKKLPNLEKLVLNSRRADFSDNILGCLTNLKHLSFRMNRNKLDFLKDLKYLETLEISSYRRLQNEFYFKIMPHLYNLKRLRLEDIMDERFSYMHINRPTRRLHSSICTKQYLTHLELINFEVPYEQLTKYPNLQHVTLGSTKPKAFNVNEISVLTDSNIETFVLNVTSYNLDTFFRYATERSLEDLYLFLDLNLIDPHTEKLGLALSEVNLKKFAVCFQDILCNVLPNIEVEVVDYRDKWVALECKQYKLFEPTCRRSPPVPWSTWKISLMQYFLAIVRFESHYEDQIQAYYT